jgi:hypothetical protein
MFGTDWRKRAQAAEVSLREADKHIADARQSLEQVQMMHRDRAALVSITQNGRTLAFTFVRNGELTVCETYSTMEADVPAWRAALLDRLTEEH